LADAAAFDEALVDLGFRPDHVDLARIIDAESKGAVDGQEIIDGGEGISRYVCIPINRPD
jgi:hypothetical protein